MIAPGGSEPVKQSDFLVDGVVAYPGMKSVHITSQSSMADVEQSSASESDSEKGDFDHQYFFSPFNIFWVEYLLTGVLVMRK